MDGMSRNSQSSFLTSVDGLLPDVGEILSRVATNEYPFRITKVSGFGDESVNFRIDYRTLFFDSRIHLVLAATLQDIYSYFNSPLNGTVLAKP